MLTVAFLILFLLDRSRLFVSSFHIQLLCQLSLVIGAKVVIIPSIEIRAKSICVTLVSFVRTHSTTKWVLIFTLERI